MNLLIGIILLFAIWTPIILWCRGSKKKAAKIPTQKTRRKFHPEVDRLLEMDPVLNN